MNSTVNARCILPILLTSALLAGGAAAQGHGMVPFNGGFTGFGTPVSITSGHTTQLGYFTGTSTVVAFTQTGLIGTYINQGANGDTVFGGYVVTLGQPVGPNVFAFTAIGTVLGGTGRFEGATGSFVAQGTTNFATSELITTVEGTISSVGSLH